MLKVKKLTDNAVLPVKGSEGAAGYDLTAAKDVEIRMFEQALIPTDLAFEFPPGVYGRIAPRSGFSWRSNSIVNAGVIDADYRGNVQVMLFNFNENDVFIKKGDKIAQLILEKYESVEVIEVDKLSVTYRGEKGFGSTD